MNKLLFNTKEVMQLTGLSRSYIYKLMEENKFPKPLKVGSHNAWKLEQLEQWIESLEK